jgi:hypothetical protein
MIGFSAWRVVDVTHAIGDIRVRLFYTDSLFMMTAKFGADCVVALSAVVWSITN